MALGNYESVSIREAMERINCINDGWFLPNIQRQYVWGSRDSSEEYICLLLDSILKGYPIGGLVLWETSESIPFREFLGDYSYGFVTKIVPEDRWGMHKFLVYDGQQRLQTLYSVLYHRFNGRILYFDLLFDEKDGDVDETGFYFKNPNEESVSTSISLVALTSKNPDISDKIALQNAFTSNQMLSQEEKTRIEANLERLWTVFVEKKIRSIAYFPVSSKTSYEVNEVFRRLNTGGIQLSQLEMVLAKIKEASAFYEEELWDISRNIWKATAGIDFSALEIMQLIYLMVFQTIRVDESRISKDSIGHLVSMLDAVKEVLPSFFETFFFEGFHINKKWLIIRTQAIFPMLAYCVKLKLSGFEWKLWKIGSFREMKTYFIKSQLCDWNTQTMVNAFARLAIEKAERNEPFPLSEITSVALKKNRTSEVYFYQLESQPWFSLKVLTPSRMYLFNDRTPQIDHIYPKNLHKGLSDETSYRTAVDVIWNMQPTPAGLNREKWDKHPVVFFTSEVGRSFIGSYDFVPRDLSDKAWQNENDFIEYRKHLMVDFMKKEYDIVLQENVEDSIN